MVTLDGTITDKKDGGSGRKTKHILTHLRLVFVLDEVGSNSSQ
jgi:hypothetical protein